MAITGIGAGASPALLQRPTAGSSPLLELKEAVSKGDLNKARESFSTLQRTGPTGDKRTQALSAAFDNLDRALSTGDLSTTRAAFSALQSQLRASPTKAAESAAQQPTPATPPTSPTAGAGPDSEGGGRKGVSVVA